MTIDKTFTAYNLSIHQLTHHDFQAEIATLRLFIKHLPEMNIEINELNPTLGELQLFTTPEKNLKWLAYRFESIIQTLETLHEQSAKIDHAVSLVEAGINPGQRLDISGGE